MIKQLNNRINIYFNDLTAGPVSAAEPLRLNMLRDITWLVLFSYLLLIFNALLPVLADAIAHTFWEKEHLLTVHEVNGKYHVHFELLNNAKHADKDKNPGSVKNNSEGNIHLLLGHTYDFSNNYFTSTPYSRFLVNYTFAFTNTSYRPPKAQSKQRYLFINRIGYILHANYMGQPAFLHKIRAVFITAILKGTPTG